MSYGYTQVFLNTKIIKPIYNSKIKLIHGIGVLLRKLSLFIYKCDVDPNAIVPKSTRFTHYIGIIIGPCEIGENCSILQHVTIGRKSSAKNAYPRIGNNVSVGANSVLLGDISIGDNAVIGAGSIVVKDVETNTVVAGNPARELSIK